LGWAELDLGVHLARVPEARAIRPVTLSRVRELCSGLLSRPIENWFLGFTGGRSRGGPPPEGQLSARSHWDRRDQGDQCRFGRKEVDEFCPLASLRIADRLGAETVRKKSSGIRPRTVPTIPQTKAPIGRPLDAVDAGGGGGARWSVHCSPSQ
jgi:hypothetical protein